MREPVKKRRYVSEVRARRAEETRRRILEAATELFVANGYAATTIESVAERAGVATQTVYAVYRTKRELLAATARYAVRGTVADQPLLEQRGPRSVRDAPSQRAQLRLFARDVAARLDRVGPVMQIVDEAARREPAIAELRAGLHRGRLASYATAIEWLTARGGLRPPLDRHTAAEHVWALASPELHQLLRRDRGWSRPRYARWLETTLVRTLLPDDELR